MAPNAFHYAPFDPEGNPILDSPPPLSEHRPRAGRPSREQAEARNDELLDIALDIFLQRGFEQTTIEAIAAAVGMTKRTIYAKHADKAALFKAAVRRAIERNVVPRETLEALDTGELESTLIAFARMRIANVDTPAGLRLQRILNTESYRFPEIFKWSSEEGAGSAIAFLADLLRRYDTAGAVCLDRPEMAASAFMSMVVSGPVRLIVSGNPPSQREIDTRIEFAVRLFLEGARPR